MPPPPPPPLAAQVLSFAGSERVSRRLRATVGAFWGRGRLPLPHKTDIIMAMGPPIPVKQVGIADDRMC